MKNKKAYDEKFNPNALDSILCDLSKCANEKELITNALNVLGSMTGIESASYFVYDKSSKDYKVCVSTVLPYPKIIQKVFNDLITAQRISDTFKSGILLEDIKIAENDTCNYCLIKPIIHEQEVLGILLLIDEHVEKFSDATKNIVNVLCNVVSIMITNLNLKNEIKHSDNKTALIKSESSEEMIETRSELKTILDFLNSGILIVERNTGVIADVNLMAQKIIGISKEEIIGKNRSELFLFAEPLNTIKEVVSSSEGMLLANDGSIRQIIHHSFEVTINNNIFWVDNFIDISDRKDMELALQKAHDDLESRVAERTKELSDANNQLQIQIKERVQAEEDRLKLFWAVHQSPTMIIITDFNGNIEYVNPSFVKITGYSFDQVIGRNPRFLKSGEVDEDTYSVLWKTIISGREWKSEFRNKKKNGDKFWVSSTVSPVKNIEGRITNFLAVQEDITEQKKAESELIIAKEKAESSAKFKAKLLANLSHEFRTPLISIIGFADFIKDELSNEEHVELVKDISNSGKRLLDTLSSVMLLSQLESIDENLRLVDADISERIEELLSPHIMSAEMKGIKLNYEKLTTPVEAKIDHALFDQMINGIINNAIKYTNEGMVSIRTYVYKNKFAAVDVVDTGIGIAANNLKIIFDSFTQVSEGYTRDFEGCGLGLTLAKKISETLGGSIKVSSTPGAGSTFTIILPLSKEINRDFHGTLQFHNKELN